MTPITFTINGEKETHEVAGSWTLLYFLREVLHLTGIKEGCGEGECGACTVIMNGKTIHGCMTLAAEADGAEITTIEGIIGKNGELDIIQEKFIEHGAIQCGFCTPGMVLSAKSLLTRNSNPSTEEIKESIEGNVCRCTGYKQIVEAIQACKRGE